MKCEKCNVGDMVEKPGQHGPFLGCSEYNNTGCNNTKTIKKEKILGDVSEEIQKSYDAWTNKPVALVEKPTKTYELTDGNIRIGALRCAVERQKDSNEFNWKLVRRFERYIRNGE